MRTDELCAALTGWLKRLMPEDDRRARLIAELSGPDDRPVDTAVCAELQTRARRHSRHLDLEWVPEGGLVTDTESRGWPKPDAAEVAVRRAGISTWHFGEVGVLAVAGLSPLALAEPFLQAAFAELRGAPAAIIDLRANGGGDLDTAMAVLGWLLGPDPVHVSDVVAQDGTRRWHSDPRPGLSLDTPAAVLIGAGTYSSGEALAYHFQAQGRGPLVGARTPGAADHVTPIVLSPHVRANLPRAYVIDAITMSNWEQTGVQPDIPCGEADALERALALYPQTP